jgi:hypothetical protein
VLATANLLDATGKTPTNLELFRAENEMIHIGQMMIERVAAFEAGEFTSAQLGEFFRGVVTSSRPLTECQEG